MFTGMLLHQIEAPFKIDDTMNDTACFQRCIRIVNDYSVFAMNFLDEYVVQPSLIVGLATAFRIKGRLVQYQRIAFFVRFAGQDSGVKFL